MYLVSVSSKHYALNPKVLRHIHTLNHPSLSNLSLLILVLIMLRYQPSLLGALSILVSISPQIRSCYSQLAIPVTAPNIPDSVVWLYSKNGAFTVKSGYHFQDYEDVQYATSS